MGVFVWTTKQSLSLVGRRIIAWALLVWSISMVTPNQADALGSCSRLQDCQDFSTFMTEYGTHMIYFDDRNTYVTYLEDLVDYQDYLINGWTPVSQPTSVTKPTEPSTPTTLTVNGDYVSDLDDYEGYLDDMIVYQNYLINGWTPYSLPSTVTEPTVPSDLLTHTLSFDPRTFDVSQCQ